MAARRHIDWRYWLARAACLALVILAAFLAGRHPFASAALVVLVSAVLGMGWWVERHLEALLEAGRNGDVDALRRMARDIEPDDAVAAILAVAVFEGIGAVEPGLREICDCGRADCKNRWLNAEVETMLRSMQVCLEGRWKEAAETLTREPSPSPKTRTNRMIARRLWSVRLAALSFATLRSEGRLKPKTIQTFLKTSVRGRVIETAVQFAAARRLHRQGDDDGARAMLARLPPWKPGSRLAKERDALARELSEGAP